MAHNIITLLHDRFDTRCALGSPLLNIGGETHDVEVFRQQGDSVTNCRYLIHKKGTTELLCEFHTWHLHGGPDMYQISGASLNGHADATLIVIPTLEAWERQFADPDDEDESE